MPVDSGPTMLLPYSQRFAAGCIAFHRPEFIDYFAGSLDRAAMVRAVYPALRGQEERRLP